MRTLTPIARRLRSSRILSVSFVLAILLAAGAARLAIAGDLAAATFDQPVISEENTNALSDASADGKTATVTFDNLFVIAGRKDTPTARARTFLSTLPMKGGTAGGKARIVLQGYVFMDPGAEASLVSIANGEAHAFDFKGAPADKDGNLLPKDCTGFETSGLKTPARPKSAPANDAQTATASSYMQCFEVGVRPGEDLKLSIYLLLNQSETVEPKPEAYLSVDTLDGAMKSLATAANP